MVPPRCFKIFFIYIYKAHGYIVWVLWDIGYDNIFLNFMKTMALQFLVSHSLGPIPLSSQQVFFFFHLHVINGGRSVHPL